MASRTASLEAAINECLALGERLESEASQETAQETLKRLLSIKSVVSTSSSLAQRYQSAVETHRAFRKIGTGSIGKIFEHSGTIWVYKLPLTDVSSKLWNNYVMNRRISDSFENSGSLAKLVDVPRAFWYAQSTTTAFWDDNIDRFPWTISFERRRRDVLCTERIFPLPKPTRERLIDLFCPPHIQESAKSHLANQDCLVRPLLGRRRHNVSSRLSSFSLRNFKLHLDQILEIDLDPKEMALAMADSLAILHWNTKIDAMDIEFVLGSTPQEDQQARRVIPLQKLLAVNVPTSTFEYITNSDPNFGKRLTSLWLLDFDACSDMGLHFGLGRN
ncbi:MAG: hypothetical protein Q9219_002796 [cf. Caloplaca sp. 3 TL-2023]